MSQIKRITLFILLLQFPFLSHSYCEPGEIYFRGTIEEYDEFIKDLRRDANNIQTEIDLLNNEKANHKSLLLTLKENTTLRKESLEVLERTRNSLDSVEIIEDLLLDLEELILNQELVLNQYRDVLRRKIKKPWIKI